MPDKKKERKQPVVRLTNEERAIFDSAGPPDTKREQENWERTVRSVNARGARAMVGLPEIPMPFEGGVSDADLEPFAPRTKCGRKEKNK